MFNISIWVKRAGAFPLHLKIESNRTLRATFTKWGTITCESNPHVPPIIVVSFAGDLRESHCFLNTGAVGSFEYDVSKLPRAVHFRARSQAVGNLLTEKAPFVIVIRKVYNNRSHTCTLTVRLWLLWREQTSVIDRLQCRTVNHVTSRPVVFVC